MYILYIHTCTPYMPFSVPSFAEPWSVISANSIMSAPFRISVPAATFKRRIAPIRTSASLFPG